MIFNLFKLLPQKDKICFVISFEENSAFIHKELLNQRVQAEIILLCKPSLINEIRKNCQNTTIIPFECSNVLYWILSLYHLSTSRIVLIDNYFAFLSAIKFKQNVECIQLWHAVGALKSFGLTDKSVAYRTAVARRRFNMVYQKFDKIIVGSERMANIFLESFGIPPKNILRTGIPRTDFFFDKEKLVQVTKNIYRDYPQFHGKKIILYAPTFRDHQLNHYELHLEIEKMRQALQSEYLLLIKLHPAVQNTIDYERMYPNFVYDVSNYKQTNELLVITDYLITDYSSIPFEFALLKKPMIFFPYDFELYKKDRGLIEEYLLELPGPVAYKTDELVNIILYHKFDFDLINSFSLKWNEYSIGNSSEKLVQYIVKQIKS